MNARPNVYIFMMSHSTNRSKLTFSLKKFTEAQIVFAIKQSETGTRVEEMVRLSLCRPLQLPVTTHLAKLRFAKPPLYQYCAILMPLGLLGPFQIK